MARGRVGLLPVLAGVAVLAAPLAVRLSAQQWQEYGPGERLDALRNYRRHRELPEERQRQVEEQYERWRQMPEEERDRIRENYERYRRMPPQERSLFEDKYRTWKRERRP